MDCLGFPNGVGLGVTQMKNAFLVAQVGQPPNGPFGGPSAMPHPGRLGGQPPCARPPLAPSLPSTSLTPPGASRAPEGASAAGQVPQMGGSAGGARFPSFRPPQLPQGGVSQPEVERLCGPARLLGGVQEQSPLEGSLGATGSGGAESSPSLREQFLCPITQVRLARVRVYETWDELG